MFPGGMPNMANVDNSQLKGQANKFATMSDEELEGYINQVKGFNPMFASMTPAMLRQTGAMMNGMGDAQINSMKNMAQNQYAGGQAPTNPAQQNPSQQAAPQQDNVPQDAKDDYETAKVLKTEAATHFKSLNYSEATEKYYKILNIIRENTSLKGCKSGKDMEITSRLNIALCCLNDKKNYQVAVDQCERVLDMDARNWKAQFRMANALYQQNDECKDNQGIRQVYNYAKKAADQQRTEAKVQEFFKMVKGKFDEWQKETGTKDDEPKKPKIKKIKIDDPEDKNIPKAQPQPQEEEKKATAPEEQPRQPAQQAPPQNFGGMGGMDPNLSDDQLRAHIDSLKNNRELARSQIAAQMGREMSDAELDNYLNMMSPDMIRMAMNMAKANPNMVNNMRNPQGGAGVAPNAQIPGNVPATAGPTPPQGTNPMMPMGPDGQPDMQAMMDNPMMKEFMNNPELMKNAMEMMQGMQGGQGAAGGGDPNAMADMMKNPSLQGLLKNPEMITTSLNMLKSNPAMLDMMEKQFPGQSRDTIVRMLDIVGSIAGFYAKTRNFFSHQLVKGSLILVFVATMFWYFG